MRVFRNVNKMSYNTKVVFYGVIGTLGVKGISLFVSLFTMPSYMNYFSSSKILGLWFTILSVLTWILNFDFGISNGLRNRLVKYLVINDKESIKKSISSSYIYLIKISGVILFIFILSNLIIDWNSIFSISNDVITASDLNITVIIVVMSILVQLILRIITSILYALQLPYIPNLLALVTNIILIIAVNILIRFNVRDNIIVLAIIYFFSVNMPLFIATIMIFRGKLKEFCPSLRDYDKNVAKDILGFGFAFLWLSLMSMLIQSTNEFLITKLISSEEVVIYSVFQKIFMTVSTLFTLTLNPVWSAITKAKEENKFAWIYKLYKLLILISIVAMGFLILLSLNFQLVVDIWLGDNSIFVSTEFALIFGTFSFINILAGILTTLSNGMGLLKSEIILLTLGAILNFPLAIYFSNIYNSFIVIIVANIISLLPFTLIQMILIVKYLRDKIK
ncbi:MAG: hypothetical protein E6370_11915 [Clostridiales bacterium]|nr:hypothetical protein [Clostridiales bacterium]MDU6975015.1 hypothetical protein [Clostridiales bacterium]